MRSVSPVEARVIALIEPQAAEMGYRIVRVRFNGARRKTLQIMAERLSDGLFDPADCGRLSRYANEALEPIEYDTLEVSSPGIDRPLMSLEDFQRFAGHEAKLETLALVDGRKRFKGVLVGVEGGNVRLKTEEGDVSLAFDGLADARLVLTDRLIEEDLRRAKKAEAEDKENNKGTMQ